MTAQIIPFPTAPKPATPVTEPRTDVVKRKRAPKAPASLALRVQCKAAGSYTDLVGQIGVLTIDYARSGVPVRAHFDPDDTATDSCEMSVVAYEEQPMALQIQSRSTAWKFALVDVEEIE